MVNTLLVFLAIPLSTIILSAIFETFIENPIKVFGIFFSVFFVIAFYLGGTAELILASIVYSLISFFTALIVYLLTRHHLCKMKNTNCLDNCLSASNYFDNSAVESTSTNDETNAVANNIPRCRRFR